jgi:hypothetical protein
MGVVVLINGADFFLAILASVVRTNELYPSFLVPDQ